MGLTKEQKNLLRGIFPKLNPTEPLKPADPRYQPIEAAIDNENPVACLQQHIELSGPESQQLFSGFRGSGKTTQLFRLKRELEREGYVVLYSDAMKYLNPAQPVDITSLLAVLGGAFADALEEWARELRQSINLTAETYWQRLAAYLIKTKVEIPEAGLQAGGINLKFAFKSSETFRQHIHTTLERQGRIGELQLETQRYFEDGIKAVRQAAGDDAKQVVFIFDSLEQIRGSRLNEEEILKSVEAVFTQELARLRLPYLHVIYTVPPWLKFIAPGLAESYLLPNIKLWHNDTERSRDEKGWAVMREFVWKRIGREGCHAIFGSAECQAGTPADKFIEMSGGHFRDMLRLLQETLRRTETLPVPPEIINRSIQSVREQFLPIALDDAAWLTRVGATRNVMLQNTTTQAASRLMKFFDGHFVLYLRNGTYWYDLHPMIWDEVKKLGELNRQAADVFRPTANNAL